MKLAPSLTIVALSLLLAASPASAKAASKCDSGLTKTETLPTPAPSVPAMTPVATPTTPAPTQHQETVTPAPTPASTASTPAVTPAPIAEDSADQETDDYDITDEEDVGADYDAADEVGSDYDVDSSADQPQENAATPAAQQTTTQTVAPSTSQDGVDPATCLEAHNKVRAAVGVPPLTWDAALASKGASWAQHMEDLDFFDHSTPGQSDGQMNNLYSGTSCLDAVAAFESEKAQLPGDHIVRSESYLEYGHYTMVVWKSTTRVGCGRGAIKNLVCYYEEPGNVLGEAAF